MSGHWVVGTCATFRAQSSWVDFMCAGPVCGAVFECRDGHVTVGSLTTHETPSAMAGTPEKMLFEGFIWVAVKTAVVCRQAGDVTGLLAAEYTGPVTFLGTGRATNFGEGPAAAGLEHRRLPSSARMTSGPQVSTLP